MVVIGRRIRCLTVADYFTHECVDIVVDHGISGKYVTRVLDQASPARPVMLCLTTTAIDIDEELLNRCLVLTINETAQ